MALEAHVCEICDAVTLRWILWQNARGHRRYFCDNDCLGEWLKRCREHVLREGALEHQALRRAEEAFRRAGGSDA